MRVLQHGPPRLYSFLTSLPTNPSSGCGIPKALWRDVNANVPLRNASTLAGTAVWVCPLPWRLRKRSGVRGDSRVGLEEPRRYSGKRDSEGASGATRGSGAAPPQPPPRAQRGSVREAPTAQAHLGGQLAATQRNVATFSEDTVEGIYREPFPQEPSRLYSRIR
ncbi:hypothetical protein P7K49_038985 [Saguinus oedipus]|uniref:Uncharacterized protein n=1 Tax=Saguinus oedipus TaxID=9490 RepID=A0ABQ9TG84_SAGOE|nr:hypothetical protein P7K49_038985 [Saguinus oedipus]